MNLCLGKVKLNHSLRSELGSSRCIIALKLRAKSVIIYINDELNKKDGNHVNKMF